MGWLAGSIGDQENLQFGQGHKFRAATTVGQHIAQLGLASVDELPQPANRVAEPTIALAIEGAIETCRQPKTSKRMSKRGDDCTV
jgi:hypothetical protein